MVAQLDMFLYKFRYALMSVLVAGSLATAALLFSTAQAATCPATRPGMSLGASGGIDDANAVSAGLFAAADSLNQTLSVAGDRAGCAVGAAGKTFAGGSRSIAGAAARGISAVGSAIGHGFMATAQGIGYGFRATGSFLIVTTSSTARFIAGTINSLNGLLLRTPLVGAIIRPSAQAALPVIDTGTPLPLYAATALPAAKIVSQTTPPPAPAGIWPMRGAVTTEFGVPEPPYQPIHTGIDISDGAPSGVTPIRAFKPGRVIKVVHSGSGLGNNVVIDHGDNVTSVYAHMYSTSVQVGQQVDQNTILGYEGSTGASTGPHVHFEIRVGGQPVSPRRFIAGQPF